MAAAQHHLRSTFAAERRSVTGSCPLGSSPSRRKRDNKQFAHSNRPISVPADQDPLLEKEEKMWKKKQAEYDPEDEAHSDTPIAKKEIDDDDPAYCVSPSLKTSGTTRSNVDSIIQCSIEDQLQGDYLDLFGNEFVDKSMESTYQEAKEAADFLNMLQIPKQYPTGCPSRGIFCSRSLNLKTITTIGYDLDYTLIHYNVRAWEGKAYEYGLKNLNLQGFPTDGLEFDNQMVIRGLILDKEKGNLVKADRFGHITRAMHGTNMLSTRTTSQVYGGVLVDLRDEYRWEFLNTLFSISEAVLYMQLVAKLDKGQFPPALIKLNYKTLYAAVAKALFKAHIEGKLKAEIYNKPDKYVELDEELPTTLLDQKDAGKRLLLITNSDFQYTDKMMNYAFNPFLPDGMTWRNLFDLVIVSARKPEFFQRSSPLYEIVTGDGLMKPCYEPKAGGLYCGGSAFMVEKALDTHGGEILYVGDHIFTDVSQSKVNLKWRTALICRELEREVRAMARGRSHRSKLLDLMNKKEVVGDVFNQLRLAMLRRSHSRPAQTAAATVVDAGKMEDKMRKILSLLRKLDKRIAPMVEADGQHFSAKWGYLSRAGVWDKSHLTRQIEKYADVYTSRVANFGRYSPYMNFQSQAQVLGENISSEMIAGIYNLLSKEDDDWNKDQRKPSP
ncbi:hypothetical protein KC19_12G093800 [Ceratodon purpureus]|uniref:Uncharacterized protein n=1 Tax=Ceratodon purpureus TaxID=3225 RepID=A0A8T0G5B8_CERPU|nr:hypothetical protein KC19_12G093800 [Ceratodon purpureus]